MHILTSMRISAKTSEVLEVLVKNRAAHREIVVEARAGYAQRAVEVLTKELERLKAGNNVTVMFTLQAPKDHTKVYDTAIAMMRLHQDETVVLDSSQVRNLMLDEWDWKLDFLISNSKYSGKAAAASMQLVEEDD